MGLLQYLIKRKLLGPISIGATFFALLACAGVGSSGGGGTPGAAPGGAVGSTGSTSGQIPGPIAGPVARTNPEGVLSAPADDSFLEDCDPKAMLFYGADYKTAFDTATEKSVKVNLFDDKPFVGKFNIVSIFGASLKNLQVRVLYLDAAGSSYAYRDFLLSGTPDRQEITVEYSAPANASRIELYYIPGVKSKGGGPDDPGCVYPKTENFSEGWTVMNAAQFEELSKKNTKAFLAAFEIWLFHRLDRPDLPDLGEFIIP